MIDPVLLERLVLGLVFMFACGAFVGCITFRSLWKANARRLKHWKSKYTRTLSQKKSSEVRLGKTAENLAPFIEGWLYDPGDFRFIGNPVDGISVNDDSIVFVEIKTGKARLTKSQKHAKRLIKEGKVYFETFRISEDGVSIHREEVVKCGEEHTCSCPNKDICNGEKTHE